MSEQVPQTEKVTLLLRQHIGAAQLRVYKKAIASFMGNV